MRNKLLTFLLYILMIFSFSSVCAEELNETFKVTFIANNEIISQVEVPSGESVSSFPMQDNKEKFILSWIFDGKRVNPVEVKITKDTEFTAWKAPTLNISSHDPYISGHKGSFRPNEPISRAEFCSIYESIFTLYNNNCSTNYSDVSETDWFYSIVNNVLSSGVMTGYDDGTFRPNDTITKAEFISIVCSSYVYGEKPAALQDTKDHWAKNAITFAYEKGWVKGDENGNFNPDSAITRAEVVVIFNGILGRNAGNAKELLSKQNVYPFYDVPPTAWCYLDVMEATIPHTTSKQSTDEEWVNFKYKRSGYPEGLNFSDNKGFIVDSKGQFKYMSPWSFVDVEGKTYFTNGDGTISLSYKGVQEIYGSLYCFNEDGSILKNGAYNYLFFDETGKYTSGNESIDKYVDELILSCTIPEMSASEKLYAVYIKIRDTGKYLSREHYERGSDNFTEESAIFMFEHQMKGNCYSFSSIFLYVARRLGFSEAYIVSGGVGKKNLDHAWVMIDSLIYDVELEYAHRYQYEEKKDYNLFGIAVKDTPFEYYFPE